ncbi:MAG: 4Fe-4S dicluster domain-containing protein [Gemmatimonadaceae bacterium]|nr:4Fe-4S dicluster domain-containing protein [Gemmatimonadaceae bacterium]
MLLSKLRETVICLRAGRVTLPYPFAPSPAPPGFRGRLALDADLCIGCGGCAAVCPSGVILIEDRRPMVRTLRFALARCTYCGRCSEVCPEQALAHTTEFETATNTVADLEITIDVFMGPCQRCGRCFPPPTAHEQIPIRGFRADTDCARAGAELPVLETQAMPATTRVPMGAAETVR